MEQVAPTLAELKLVALRWHRAGAPFLNSDKFRQSFAANAKDAASQTVACILSGAARRAHVLRGGKGG